MSRRLILTLALGAMTAGLTSVAHASTTPRPHPITLSGTVQSRTPATGALTSFVVTTRHRGNMTVNVDANTHYRKSAGGTATDADVVANAKVHVIGTKTDATTASAKRVTIVASH